MLILKLIHTIICFEIGLYEEETTEAICNFCNSLNIMFPKTRNYKRKLN